MRAFIIILVMVIIQNSVKAEDVQYWTLPTVEQEWMSDATNEEECLEIVDHANFESVKDEENAIDQCLDQEY